MDYQQIIDYWFGQLKSASDFPQDKAQVWFNGGDSIDQEIKEKFTTIVELAFAEKLEGWKQNYRGWLALIITLDQFPRNIYRGTPKAFFYDQKVLSICLEGINKEEYNSLYPLEKQFFLMPLQHSEDLNVQEKSILYFDQLAVEAPLELQDHFQNVKKYARKHWEIIKRFGRFPHRNIILGRFSTADETEFLKTPGSSF